MENQVPNADKILLVKKEEEQGGLLTLLNIESQYKTLKTNILGYLGRERLMRPMNQNWNTDLHIYGDLFVTEWVLHISAGKGCTIQEARTISYPYEKRLSGISTPNSTHKPITSWVKV